MRSWLYLFICNMMWALQFTCIKLVQDQVGPMFTVWGPMTLALLGLWPWLRHETAADVPVGQGRRPRLLWTYLLLAALGVFPGQVFMTWGTRMSLASNAAVIYLTMPVTTALFAFLFLRERRTAVRWFSFAVAIVGVVLCSDIDYKSLSLGSGYLAGNLLILGATLGSSFYNSYGKKALLWHSPMRMLFYTYAAICALMGKIPTVAGQRAPQDAGGAKQHEQQRHTPLYALEVGPEPGSPVRATHEIRRRYPIRGCSLYWASRQRWPHLPFLRSHSFP